MNGEETPKPQPEFISTDPDAPPPLLLRLGAFFKGPGNGIRGRWRGRWPRRILLLALVVVLIYVMQHGIARVRETEVGVQVDNLTGELVLRDRAGYHLFVPYLSQFYVLDRTSQRLDLSWRQGPGGAGRDLKLKTADGSNVSLDMIINFKLIPDKAPQVLRRSGTGLRFAETWIEPFARHVCFSSFGQLTTEEMYDAAKRNERAQESLTELNARLGPYGIEVVSVIPGEFRFYKEYEQVIQEKKLADQQVEEQQAQARASLQDQERQLVEATKRAETRLASFQGECANRMIQAEADANKVRREADGRYSATVLSADASLYSADKQATGTKATLLAEADGMEQMRRALAGDGGLGMIGLEYAKRLGHIRFSATPITREPSIHQFAMDAGALAAGSAEAARAAAQGPSVGRPPETPQPAPGVPPAAQRGAAGAPPAGPPPQRGAAVGPPAGTP
ncbi:MAG TPA: SPFH domain-containing protein, partial [Phycisphaerae bacterium]